MKTIFYSLIVASIIYGCGKKEEPEVEIGAVETVDVSPVELGRQLYEGPGNCFSCHKPDQKIIGPSLQEIATIYKDNNGDMVAFLKGEAEPIVDPSQYEVMKTNFSITKAMTDEQLNALEAYIYSFLPESASQ